MGNYSFKTPPPAENGATISDHNLTQAVPHTKIYEGITGLTFRGCNLTNCDVPADAVVLDSLRIHRSFCSHIHPELAEKGCIAGCGEACAHRTVVDTILVDGVAVDTNSTYEDKAVA